MDGLEVRGITVRFGGFHALSDVSLSVSDGEMFGIVGPNGAGKTTLLNVLTGLIRPVAGTATYQAKALLGLKPWNVAKLGIARSFQSAEHFSGFTALEYVMLGRLQVQYRSVGGHGLGLPRFRAEQRDERRYSEGVLARLDLAAYADAPLHSLPYGTQKIIDIARVLASEPKCVLLDEPTSGVASNERQAIRDLLRRIHHDGTTLVVIDHDVGFIRSLCKNLLVIAEGREIGSGAADEVLARREVIDAYLGEDVIND